MQVKFTSLFINFVWRQNKYLITYLANIAIISHKSSYLRLFAGSSGGELSEFRE